MLHYIKGELTIKLEDAVVVEAGGLGYHITVASNSAVYLAKEGDPVTLYLYMAVREDDVSLYGFADRDELALFKQLITVNGVGAKAGMSILSALPAPECKKAIAFEDAASLTRANGIGKKTAQRIVLELKDKIDITGVAAGGDAVSFNTDAASSSAGQRGEAINALIALGYSRSEAMNAIGKVKEEDLSSEEYIKQALKQLF